MSASSLLFIIVLMALVSYWVAIQRSISVAGGHKKIKNLVCLPSQYALLTALWCGIPAILFLGLWLSLESYVIDRLLIASLTEDVRADVGRIGLVLNNIKILAGEILLDQPISLDNTQFIEAARYLNELEQNAKYLKTVLSLLIALASVIFILSRISETYHARNKLETIIKSLLFICSAIALLTTIGIVLSVLFESISFFNQVPITEFLFGTHWSPQIALRVDQVAGSGAFGAVPLFLGTILISTIAIALSVPVGLMIAIYLSQYASSRVRSTAKPMLEILAGVPTVVYGFFAALTIAPMMRDFGVWVGLPIAAESALAAGLVMGIMIIPFVSSLSEDALTAVPSALKEGSLGMGATESETIRKVLLPAAIPGIVGAILLAISRAIGETMIVVMAAGLAANLTFNPIESVTTVTVQIVTLLKGDQEFDSPKTLAAFALGLMLFVTTLALNIAALKIVRKYREQYD
jgi:phosphate transport system permease protein